MIAALFTLSGLALLMIQILAADTLVGIREARRGILRAFDHDTKIYPDN